MAARKSTISNYRKERKKVLARVRRLEKRGYEVTLPDIDVKNGNYSKATAKLKKLTTENLYKRSRFIDFETGEILTSKQGRALERSKSAKKAAATRAAKAEYRAYQERVKTSGATMSQYDVAFTIVARFKSEISDLGGKYVYLLNGWIDEVVSQEGYVNTAKMIQDALAKEYMITVRELNYEELTAEYFDRMLKYLPASIILRQDKALEQIEEDGELWNEL